MSGDWRSHFPSAKIRPIQEKALDFVAQAIADGVDNIGGSSHRHWQESDGDRDRRDVWRFITTSSIALENQYMADFARVGLKQLHAKDWYDCPECDNCRSGNEICSLDEEGAALERLIRKGEESYTPGCLRCPYREARYQFFQKSWCGISNAAYLLTYARFVSPFPRRPVVIFDEAHTLSDWITKLFAVDLTFRDVDHAIKMPKDTKEVWDWLETEICPWLKAEISRLDAQRSETKKRYFTARSIEREWLANTLKVLLRETARRANQLNNLKVIIQNNPREWVSEIIAEERRIKITPLWPHSVAAPLLEQIAPIRVYLSATLAGMWNQAEWLGIDSRHSGTRFLSLPSPFPVENRPIIIRPKVRWNSDATTSNPPIRKPQRKLSYCWRRTKVNGESFTARATARCARSSSIATIPG